MDVQRLGEVRTVLGEGPYWDPTEGKLYFIDVRASKILRYNPDDHSFQTWTTPLPPAGISRTADDRLIAVLSDGFYDFDPIQGVFGVLARVAFDNEEETLNDAKVDRQGRFVAGATNNGSGRASAGLYRLDGNEVTKIDSGFSICNGPCWSPDGRTFYLADTGPSLLYAYDYDIATGAVSNKRVFSDISDVNGRPDGATVDAEGRVWWTFVLGDGGLMCFNPDGSVHQRLSTGIKWMTSIQFGGDDFRSIYLTSLDPEATGRPETDPCGGALFKIEGAGAVGLPEALAVPAVPGSTKTG